ncbi:type VI secretion protein IcmF/TssM N-terminal domain-containing protein [Pirellulales bacterium]|nr:type VI secretion protein IcmF/TssM N-terminal domain-containing protein [Pirellulales bacterium]
MADEPEDAGNAPPDNAGAAVEADQGPPSPASTAGMASCLTASILLVLILATLIAVWWNPNILPVGMAWGLWRWLGIGLLLVIIPIVVFRAVTLWIMGEGPRFVDIEFAWRAGIDAMAEQGITLKNAPLFLILGGGSEKLRKNLMAASGMEFRVKGAPDARAPLHWYASREAIFLYLDDVAWTNLAARKYRAGRRAPAGPVGPSDKPERPGGGRQAIVSTIVPGGGQSAPAATNLPDDDPRNPSDGLDAPTPSPRAPRSRPAAYMGTISPDHVQTPEASAKGAPATPKPRRVRRAPSDESSQQLRRLEAVCAKLRRHRQPVCPVNGMLILLPFDLLQASRADIEEVERALSADIATSQRELQIRCPITALVVAMEQERGFRELIRRIGREHAARQRFGKGFDLRIEPTGDELRKFTSYVCGAFEDWVYTLFREDKVLSHTGNADLYNLLCKVRRSFQARLSDVLSKGFGYDPTVDATPLLFSGCYFAATGAQPERQAFVSGVLSKLREEQEDLEWTYDAIAADGRRGRAAMFGWIAVSVLAIVLVAMLATNWFAGA